jgi:hypothetical protein
MPACDKREFDGKGSMTPFFAGEALFFRAILASAALI